MSGAFQQGERNNTLVLAAILLLFIVSFFLDPNLSLPLPILLSGGLGYALYSQNRLKSMLLTILMTAILLSYPFIAGLDEWPGFLPFFKTLNPTKVIIPYCAAVFFAAVDHSNLVYSLANYSVSIFIILYVFIDFASGIN